MSHVGGYKYLFADLLTGVVHLELPVYGVWLERAINGTGNATFSFALDSEGYSNSDVLEATQPGKSCIYVDRGGSLIWGGPIWSRTYQSEAKVLNYTAQTFESYFNKQYIEEDLSYTNMDQRDILIELINHMQSKAFANIGLILPELGSWPIGLEAAEVPVFRSVNFKQAQVWTYGRAIEYMVEFDDGFDWTIEVRYGEGNFPQRVVSTDNMLGTLLRSTQLVFEYPSNIKNYWFPENASRAATTTIGVGAGDDEGKLLSKATDLFLYDEGYPDLQETYDNQDVTRQSTLNSQTLRAQRLNRVPISVPTIELSPDIVPEVGSWNMGDHTRVYIEDPRFPDGKEIVTRVIGWELRPTSSGELEEVKLIVPECPDSRCLHNQ